jgi:glycosyltransferase involved in cell wall biosynthesis
MAQIAIIMATYNGQKYLREQINSILENTCRSYELHICDDGSKDQTVAIAKEYEQQFPGTVFVHQNEKNRGVIRNFLCAAQELEADYYMFCDQDDVWLSDKIQKTLDFMQKTEGKAANGKETPVVVFGDAKVVDQDLKEICPSFHRHSNLDTSKLDLIHLVMENKLIGCTIMFNRALQQKLTVFPEKIRMHDWWVGLIGAALGEVAYLKEPLLLYRQHGTNTLGSMTELEYIRKNIHDLGAQRQALYANCYQAGTLLSVYSEEMTPEQRKLMQIFSEVPDKNWITRRYRVFRYGFTKTGFVRNFGNFVIL